MTKNYIKFRLNGAVLAKLLGNHSKNTEYLKHFPNNS